MNNPIPDIAAIVANHMFVRAAAVRLRRGIFVYCFGAGAGAVIFTVDPET